MDASAIQKIKAAIYEVTGNDSLEINENSLLEDDLGMDSVDLASLVMEIEEQFDGSVEDSELMNLKSVADVVTLVTTKFTQH